MEREVWNVRASSAFDFSRPSGKQEMESLARIAMRRVPIGQYARARWLLGALWLVEGSQLDFAQEAFWTLRNNHFHSMSDVFWRKHLGGIFGAVPGEFGGHTARADDADADSITA